MEKRDFIDKDKHSCFLNIGVLFAHTFPQNDKCIEKCNFEQKRRIKDYAIIQNMRIKAEE